MVLVVLWFRSQDNKMVANEQPSGTALFKKNGLLKEAVNKLIFSGGNLLS